MQNSASFCLCPDPLSVSAASVEPLLSCSPVTDQRQKLTLLEIIMKRNPYSRVWRVSAFIFVVLKVQTALLESSFETS